MRLLHSLLLDFRHDDDNIVSVGRQDAEAVRARVASRVASAC